MGGDNIFGDTVQSYSNQLASTPQPFRKHVLVCGNRRPDGCLHKGGAEVKSELFAEVVNHDLTDVKISSVQDLGYCEEGPVAVVYPDNVWYKNLTVDDVSQIIQEHLIDDSPVSELAFDPQLPADFHHIIVCTFLSNCGPEGGGNRFRELVELTEEDENMRITQSHGCLKECSMGPVCCVYPDGHWYAGLTESKTEHIAATYTDDSDDSDYRTGSLK